MALRLGQVDPATRHAQQQEPVAAAAAAPAKMTPTAATGVPEVTPSECPPNGLLQRLLTLTLHPSSPHPFPRITHERGPDLPLHQA